MPSAKKWASEFLVNTTIQGIQYEPTIVTLADGRFVVTWSDTSNGTDVDIRARVLNADGSQAVAEFVVATTTADHQYEPTLAALQDGRFVVTWSDTSNGTDVDVRAAIFNGDGSPSVAEFIVTSTAGDDQFEPTVATLADGRFVVAWADNSGASSDIRARVFNTDGSAATGDVLVDGAGSSQFQPVVTALVDGRFVVAWTDDSRSGGDTSELAIRATVLNADGSVSQPQFLINSTHAGTQMDPTIVQLTDGRFVAAWSDYSGSGADGSVGAIRARVFDSHFAQLGNDFVVNTTTAGYQGRPDVAALADGRFVVAWDDYSRSGDDISQLAVRAQVFHSNGVASGAEFVVNTTTADQQFDPSITVLADGRFAVAWADHSGIGGDTGWAVHAQIFTPNAIPAASMADHALQRNEWSQVQSWLSYADADADAATMYQFWDEGTAADSGYFWTPANEHHAANTPITVAAADLANVWVRGGASLGSETMWVRAFDGTDWSAWDQFTFSTVPNTAPVATVGDHSLHTREWSQVQSWVSYSDADGDAATVYQFWDEGTAAGSGYFWTPSNDHHAANTPITVAAADLANVWVRGGTAAGNETMWVRAFDGTDWSAWDQFTFTTMPNAAPVATVSDHSLHVNEWSQVQSWLSYADADGHAAVTYQFWDEGTAAGSGYFWTPADEHHAANTAITVAAAELGNVWVRGGASVGSETMWVRAFDGTDWSAWDQFSLTTIV